MSLSFFPYDQASIEPMMRRSMRKRLTTTNQPNRPLMLRTPPGQPNFWPIAPMEETTGIASKTPMIQIRVLGWGEPYKSVDIDKVAQFATGEPVAEVSRANAGLIQRDMRHAQRARDVLREIPIADLLTMMKKAGELYTEAELPLGDGTQTPDQFARMQSATTGLPEHMCRFNMKKNHFVLSEMENILDALTRGLDLDILSRGFGAEARGVPVSYQAQSPVLGMVLPSN